MKRVFIINPHAGKGDNEGKIREKIAANKIDAEIFVTKGKKDATELVKNYCDSHKDEKLRFYACGGDGTLNEVINGAVGYENVSVYPYPCGSGNDFVKYYGAPEDFLDLSEVDAETEVDADLLESGGRYSVNVANFGFDAAVCENMERVRRKRLIGGKNAYTTGIVMALVKNMRSPCRVYADGRAIENNAILLCTVANGKYVGGQYRCAPLSDNTDGLLEICLVRPVSRLKFIGLIGEYKRGTHLEPKFEKYICYRRAKSVRVVSDTSLPYCLDGEVFYGKEFEFKIAHRGIKIAIPGKLSKKD